MSGRVTPIEKIDNALVGFCPRKADGSFDFDAVSVRKIAGISRAGHTTTQRRLKDLKNGTATLDASQRTVPNASPQPAQTVDNAADDEPAQNATVSVKVADRPDQEPARPDTPTVGGGFPATSVRPTKRSPAEVSGLATVATDLESVAAALTRTVERLEASAAPVANTPAPAPNLVPIELLMFLTDMARSVGRLEGQKSADRLVREEAVSVRVSPGEDLENDASHPVEAPRPPTARRHLPPSRSVAVPEDSESARTRFAKAAKRLLGENGPMKAGQIFALVKKSLKRSFFPRQTQQLLRWARDEGLGFDQLKDGKWRLVDQPDPARRRVAPSTKTTEMRWRFGKAAVKAIRTVGRPLGAEEIWDRAKPRPSFTRRNAANVLPFVDHPDLIKTPDGAWAVREWMAALPPRTASYHSRVRLAIYPVLGADVLRILRENRCPMTSREIRPLLDADIAKAIRNRKMADVLQQAQRDCPELVCVDDQTWGIAGRDAAKVKSSRKAVNKADRDNLERLADAVIPLLRDCEIALPDSALRRVLPDDLDQAFPRLPTALRQVQARHPELVETSPNFFAYRPARAR